MGGFIFFGGGVGLLDVFSVVNDLEIESNDLGAVNFADLRIDPLTVF